MNKEPTLPKLIEALDDTERLMLEIPESEFDISPLEARNLLPQKIENTRRYLEAVETRAEQLRNKANEMLKVARALENLHENRKEYLAKKMAEHNFERLPGDEYDLVRKPPTESVEVDDVEFTPQLLDTYSAYIKTKYEFSKTALKADLDNGITIPFARIKKKPGIRFTPRRKK